MQSTWNISLEHNPPTPCAKSLIPYSHYLIQEPSTGILLYLSKIPSIPTPLCSHGRSLRVLYSHVGVSYTPTHLSCCTHINIHVQKMFLKWWYSEPRSVI